MVAKDEGGFLMSLPLILNQKQTCFHEYSETKKTTGELGNLEM